MRNTPFAGEPRATFPPPLTASGSARLFLARSPAFFCPSPRSLAVAPPSPSPPSACGSRAVCKPGLEAWTHTRSSPCALTCLACQLACQPGTSSVPAWAPSSLPPPAPTSSAPDRPPPLGQGAGTHLGIYSVKSLKSVGHRGQERMSSVTINCTIAYLYMSRCLCR